MGIMRKKKAVDTIHLSWYAQWKAQMLVKQLKRLANGHELSDREWEEAREAADAIAEAFAEIERTARR